MPLLPPSSQEVPWLVGTALTKPRISLDRSIDRMRKQLSELTPYLRNGKAVLSLEEFDMETERLIADLLGNLGDGRCL